MSLARRSPLNPVLAREMRQRMRSPAAWVVLTASTGGVAFVARAVYVGAYRAGSTSRFDPSDPAVHGLELLHWQVFAMLMLVFLIVPALAAGTISSEREHQTLVSLLVTPMRSRSIVFGKLAASLAFLLLLVACSLPMLSIATLIGGVRSSDVVASLALVVLTAVTMASVAIAASSMLRSTQVATVVTYLVVMAVTVGTFFAQSYVDRGSSCLGDRAPFAVALNPFAAAADILGRGHPYSAQSPFTALAREYLTVDETCSGSDSVSNSVTVVVTDPNATALDNAALDDRADAKDDRPAVYRYDEYGSNIPIGVLGIPVWVVHVGASLLMAVACLGLAARRLGAVHRTRE